MATFRITDEQGTPRSFTLLTVLQLIGDSVNNNLDIGSHTYNLNTFVEIGGGSTSDNAPVASNVILTGTPQVGVALIGSWDYSDADGDAQGSSIGQWYRADNSSGLNRAAIAGATSASYTPVLGDLNKLLQFGITPVAATGNTTTGVQALSSYSAAVIAASAGNNVEWVSVSSDPYTALQSADSLTYTGSAALSSTSANAVIDVHAHPDNQYLVIRYPVANTTKTQWDESGTSNVNVPIPGVQFPHAFDARGYHYIVSDSVIFNPSSSARVTLHT